MEVAWIAWSTLSVAAVGLAQGILHVKLWELWMSLTHYFILQGGN